MTAAIEAELEAMPARALDVLARVALGVPVYRAAAVSGALARAVRQLVANGILGRRGRGCYPIRERQLERSLAARA